VLVGAAEGRQVDAQAAVLVLLPIARDAELAREAPVGRDLGVPHRGFLLLVQDGRAIHAAGDHPLAQLAAAWCFHQPGVTAAIVGARNPRQARENAAAASLELAPEHVDMLGRLFEGLELER